jgi:hypothetical protein
VLPQLHWLKLLHVEGAVMEMYFSRWLFLPLLRPLLPLLLLPLLLLFLALLELLLLKFLLLVPYRLSVLPVFVRGEVAQVG